MILLDADVLIDVAFRREPYHRSSLALLEHLDARPKSAFIAWHTLSNVYYMIRPMKGGAAARRFLSDVTEFAVVAPTDTAALRYALSLEMSDLEDAMQVAAAWSCGATWIATRNTKDFRKSPIPARSPEQLLKDLA